MSKIVILVYKVSFLLNIINKLFLRIIFGCQIATGIRLAKICITDANALVLRDIPDNCILEGVPIKVLKINININKYKKLGLK